MDNYIKIEFPSISCNEAFARAAAGAFAARLDITVDELADIKTAVSEAVTNAIVHGYSGGCGMVEMKCRALGRTIEITITDYGCGMLRLRCSRYIRGRTMRSAAVWALP